METTKIQEFIEEKGQRDFDPAITKQQLMTERTVVWSWGAKNWAGINSKCLIFQVNGKLHEGLVVITLGWEDLYSIHLFDKNEDLIGIGKTGIYAEDLVWVVDRMVETIQD